MALREAILGATYTAQEITWTKSDGVAQNLTGATLTGRIIDPKTGNARAITGTLTLTTPSLGVFTWDYSAVDVGTVGAFRVQFKATYSGGEYDLTFETNWLVKRAI